MLISCQLERRKYVDHTLTVQCPELEDISGKTRKYNTMKIPLLNLVV